MIDKYLKPWLLEVNKAPSLTTDSPFDQSLKSKLIIDSLKLLNIESKFDR